MATGTSWHGTSASSLLEPVQRVVDCARAWPARQAIRNPAHKREEAAKEPPRTLWLTARGRALRPGARDNARV